MRNKKRGCKIPLLVPKNDNKIKYVPEIIRLRTMSIFDMEQINTFALNYFHNIERKIPELEIKLEEEKDLLGPYQTFVQRRETLEKIANIEKDINLIKTSKNKKSYIVEVNPLMVTFKQIYNSKEVNKFGEEEEILPDDIVKYILKIVEVVKKYTTISFDIDLPSKICCVECEFDLTNIVAEYDGIIRCPECRVENEATRCPKKFVTIAKSVSTSHGDYSERQNFLKFIKRFQGKHGPEIDESVYRKLDEHFIKERMDVGKVVKQKPFDKKRFKVGTSLNIMLNALSVCKLSRYYDDVYFICQEYWGWDLPDLRSEEDDIMYIYDITQVAYVKIENKTRSSSISIPFKLFKILEIKKYPYDVNDFKIPKDDKSREDAEKYWKICCETCGDPNVVYIPTRRW